MPLLQITNLCFSYGHKRVLNGINMALGDGQIITLLGPNGCGKTTLLDCLIGYRPYENGSIEIDGQRDARYSVKQRAQMIAYVPQKSSGIFPYTALQMVLMGRTPYLGGAASPSQADVRIAREAMDSLGLQGFEERVYTSLSGGEQQLVLIARSLAQDAKIILLDEPTASLDIKNEALVLDRIREMAQKTKKSFVIATHQPNHAFYLENKGINVLAALFYDGMIKYFGPPSEVLHAQNVNEVYNVHCELLEYGNGQKTILVH